MRNFQGTTLRRHAGGVARDKLFSSNIHRVDHVPLEHHLRSRRRTAAGNRIGPLFLSLSAPGIRDLTRLNKTVPASSVVNVRLFDPRFHARLSRNIGQITCTVSLYIHRRKTFFDPMFPAKRDSIRTLCHLLVRHFLEKRRKKCE